MTEPETKRACPYCGVVFSINGVDADNAPINFESAGTRHGYMVPVTARDPDPAPRDPRLTVTSHLCPSCKGRIIWLNHVDYEEVPDKNLLLQVILRTDLLYPKFVEPSLPLQTPVELARDYREAAKTLDISPKASAALSRRGLQNLIRSQEKIHCRTLQQEIQGLLALGKLPKALASDLEAIRVVGNFAAHPTKDTATGEILDVEEGEAEWTLGVVHDLLVFYFETEPQSSARRAALNQKLVASGKKPLDPS